MEPLEDDKLSDRELDRILPEWKSPQAPARLRTTLFPETSPPLWRRLWNTSFRVPLPVACGLAILLALFLWRWGTPPPPRVVIRTERVEVPVVGKQTARSDESELQPVAELRPRIIRRRNAQN